MQQHSLLHILSPRAKIAYLLSLSLVRGKKDFIFIFILRYQIIVYCDVYTLLIYMHQNNEAEFLFPTQMYDNDSILLCLKQGIKRMLEMILEYHLIQLLLTMFVF